MGPYVFTLNRNPMSLTADIVIERLRGVPPRQIREHAVTVGDVTYPVVQALAKVTGEDILDINTAVARRVFKELGFKVERITRE